MMKTTTAQFLTLIWAVAGCAMLMPLSSAQAQQCTQSGNNQTCTNSIFLSGGANGVSDTGTVTLTNTTSGSISGSFNGILANNDANITNSGTIAETGASGNGISANNNATVTNSGTIAANAVNGFGIEANNGNATVTNSGVISANGDTGEGIVANGNATVTNSGMISANGASGEGIVANNGNATVINSGTISANGTNGEGIVANGNATVTNSGMISANGDGGDGIVAGNNASVTNSGTISANGTFGIGILAQNNAVVTNSGTISANGVGGNGIEADNNATVINSGTISATGKTGFGIEAFSASVINSGIISGEFAGIGSNTANITNSGTIQGATGILASAPGNTLTNSGTIIGTTGTAIDFHTSSNDSLTFLPGSRIVGAILLGGGDAVNVQTGRGLSSLLTFTPNGAFSLTAGGSAPFVVGGNRVASLDPTAFGVADRAMMDFTQGVSSLVEGRFGGMAPVGSASGLSSFAPSTSGIADSANAAFASIPSLALGYAPDAPGYLKAPAAIPGVGVTTVWSGAFGGVRNQGADGAMLAATDRAVGAALGVDRRLAPNLWLGGFIGGGTGRVSVDLNSQTVNTDYLFGGGYGRYEWGAQFINAMLYGGHSTNASTRTVTNNLAAGGLESASAHYDGWFFSPDITYGLHYLIGDGYVLTPTARLRYVAGILDGYSETGSAQNLSVGNRTLQDLEQRLELDLGKTFAVGAGNALKLDVHGGFIGLERVGDTNVNTVLLGQNLAFVTPGRSSAVGGLAGGSIDFSTVAHISLFGALEGIWMNDNSTTVTAKGGVRGTF